MIPTTKHDMYHCTCLKLLEALMLVVHPHEATKIKQLISHEPLQIDLDHDTRKLQP